MSAPVVATRRVLHPGHARAERVATAMGPRARRALVWLGEGKVLKAALVDAFAEFGAHFGAFHLLGGRLSVAAYHTAVPDDGSERAVEYGAATVIAGGASILRATGSFGNDLSGAPLIHVHGGLSDRFGCTHGGHMNADLCVIGPGGLRAILMLTVGFQQVVDRETHFSLFFPVSEAMRDEPIEDFGDHHRSRGERTVGAE
jgi:predicted DNA-binding protein with PD1-like motif